MASTLIGGLAVAAPAMAQDGAANDDVVVITGSRIQRTDTVAPSPITSVNEELFELNNVVNTEDLLNTLPQLIPAFDATSNNPGNGTATVSLRGLGTTRTLVLVDGSRFVGSGSDQVVDLNNIPAAMIERVDVVTGGASAVYGSDAVAGVVNFILRDDFEGIEVSTSHEFSLEEGDAAISDVSVTVGGNFDNGRGNAVLSYGYTHREAVFQDARDFSETAFWSPGPGNAPYDPGGSSSIPGTRIVGDDFHVMSDSSGNPVPWTPYNYAPTNYLQLPQERHMISGFATYEINDHIEFYSRGVYANNVVDSQLAPTPTGGMTVTVNTDTNPYLSDSMRALFQGDGTYDAATGTNTLTVARRMQEFGTRNSLRDTNTFQALFGLRGDLNENWSYDTFYNYSRSSISQIQSGNVSISAFEQAVFCDPSNTDASCAGVPGLNIWNGPDSILTQANAQEAIDYVTRTGAQIDVVDATQFVASLSGELQNMASPFADIAPAVVLGVEYRENSVDVRPDSVLGPDVAGFNQSLPVQGQFDVYEFFTEVDVPLITNRPGIQSLNFTGAFRMSDYSTIGNAQTYALGLGWEPVDGLRFRTQYNRAVRAPNVGDLFSPFTNGFPGAQDPCSSGRGSYSSATNDATCIAHGATPGADFQSNAQIEALFGGNANLDEEVADTFTIGAVWQPNFINGLTVQVDYYDIQIEDAIAAPLLQTILNECYIQDIAESCALVEINGRMANGALDTVPLEAGNLAVLDAEGVDLRVDYAWDAEQMGLSPDFGSFGVNYYSTFTILNGSQNTPESDYIACEGIFGGECNEPTPEYKHVMQASWYLGVLTTSLRWRHVGGVDIEESLVGDVSDRELAIDAYNYFDVTFGYDVSETTRISVGIQNVTDEQPPTLTSTSSEQANTWPATYDPFGRRLFLGANLRF
jgi:outer membrane receptor protein involved in Fe transport